MVGMLGDVINRGLGWLPDPVVTLILLTISAVFAVIAWQGRGGQKRGALRSLL